jgi:hypothetical protein
MYNEITIYIYKAIFPSGARLPPDLIEAITPSALSHVEECIIFQGCKVFMGYKHG